MGIQTDRVTVRPAPYVAFGKTVLALPYRDAIAEAGLNPVGSVELFDANLKPYFAGKIHALNHSDSFHIN